MRTRPNTALNGEKLLLVEDNELNREVTMELLRAHGLLIGTVDNSFIAVGRFKAPAPGGYACALMDTQMSVVDGYKVTRATRALEHGDTYTISVLVLIANTFVSDIEEAYSTGMNNHITGPIDVELLMEALGQ